MRRLWYRSPSRVRRFTLADRTLSWELPQVGSRQAAIAHVRISQRVAPEFPWTEITTVAADQPQQLVLPQVNPGTIYYQAIVVDVDGQEGPPVETSGTLAFDLPGSVTNFTVTDVG